ncbi:glycosyltransferase family 2 protein [Candidatus Woesearchaeota archaeon]|nr:glycosyltransferase family 2 protein [Candidatus Woesearchaeota archaeon]
MKKLSIIIPAYNEEKRIIKTLDSYYDFFYKKFKDNFELVVIPNNCKDATPEIAKNFAKKYKNCKVYNIPYFVGKGGAVIEGFKKSKGEFAGFVDADLSTDSDAFYDLYNNIDNYDAIIASRWMKGAKIGTRQPLIRRIASRVFNLLIRIMFGLRISDSQCGAKLFKRKSIIKVIDKLVTTRWAFDVDLLYLLKRNGFAIKEIPTTWNDDPNSKLNVKKTSLEMFLAITRLRLMYSPLRFIVKIYDKIMVKLK